MHTTQAHELDERLRQLQRQQQGSPAAGTSAGMSPGGESGSGEGTGGLGSTARKGKQGVWPAVRENPYAEVELQPAQVNGFTLQKSFKVGVGGRLGWWYQVGNRVR